MSDETSEPVDVDNDEPAPPSRFPIGCLAMAAIPVVLISAAVISTSSDPADDRNNPILQQIDAQRYCQDEVSARLKAPSTAEFTNVDTSGMGPFTVTGSVDSENSFGATLRATFTCHVTLVGGSWRLDHIDVS